MGASFGQLFVFFSGLAACCIPGWFWGPQSGHFGCHLEASGVDLGTFLKEFAAMLKMRDSSSIIVNDFVNLRIGSSTWEYSSVLTDTQGYLGEVLCVIVEY